MVFPPLDRVAPVKNSWASPGPMPTFTFPNGRAVPPVRSTRRAGITTTNLLFFPEPLGIGHHVNALKFHERIAMKPLHQLFGADGV